MKIVRLIVLAAIVGSNCMLVARELRSPLILQSTFGRAFMHYPIPRPKEDDTCWNFDAIGAAFARSTDSAFTDKDSTAREPLAELFFGQADFIGADVFAPSSFNAANATPLAAANPFLQFATISPRFDINEKGAWFHFTADRAFCGGRWHTGVRVNLPFRSIKTQRDDCCDLVEGLESVATRSLDQIVPTTGAQSDDPSTKQMSENRTSFGYRLDLLAALKTTSNGPLEDLMHFDTVKILDVNLGGPQYPVNVIYRPDGSVPPAPLALRLSTTNPGSLPVPVQDLPNLTANGAGTFTATGDDNNSLRAHFNQATNYTPLRNSPANLRTLWLVPTADNTPLVTDNIQLSADSQTIDNRVIQLLETINTSPINFFAANGVSFDGQQTVGVGDLDVDFYFHRENCHPCWGYYYGEGLVGVRFPTAKAQKDPGQLLKMAAGNNRHFEFRLGAQAGWEPLDWLNLKADATYAWVVGRNEKVAAPFAGSTVINIGPAIDANVKWGYFIGNLDFTFLAPHCCRTGINIGYNVYVKQKDRISLSQTTAVDFFGVTQTLDASLLENNTNRVAHKIDAEAFHQGDCWELYGGWAFAVAGKNVTRDTDWYLGFAVYF